MTTQFTTSDCVARIRRYLPNPQNLDFPANTDIFAFLQEAENETKRRLLQACPWLVLQAPTLMVTADGGLTWQYGLDADGNAIAPLGGCAIYRRKEDVPDFPLERGVDYLDENIQLRMPSNRPDPISFPDGAPYYYGNVPTVFIDATHNPTLMPIDARILIVWKATENALIALGADESKAMTKFEENMAGMIASEQLASQNSGALMAGRSTLPTRYRRLFSPYTTSRGW